MYLRQESTRWNGYTKKDLTRQCGESQPDEHLIKCPLALPGIRMHNRRYGAYQQKCYNSSHHWMEQNIQHIYIFILSIFKDYLMYIYIYIIHVIGHSIGPAPDTIRKRRENNFRFVGVGALRVLGRVQGGASKSELWVNSVE